jgi:hypothetical protein
MSRYTKTRTTNQVWDENQLKLFPNGPIYVRLIDTPLLRFCQPYQKNLDQVCPKCHYSFHVTKDESEDEVEWIHGYICQSYHQDPFSHKPYRVCLTCVWRNIPHPSVYTKPVTFNDSNTIRKGVKKTIRELGEIVVMHAENPHVMLNYIEEWVRVNHIAFTEKQARHILIGILPFIVFPEWCKTVALCIQSFVK